MKPAAARVEIAAYRRLAHIAVAAAGHRGGQNCVSAYQTKEKRRENMARIGSSWRITRESATPPLLGNGSLGASAWLAWLPLRGGVPRDNAGIM